MSNTKNISIFTTPGTWIEGESLRQLERVASFSGMKKVVGFPDLFPGKGIPIGVSMLTEGEFYPHLVGSDVGCGISLFATGLTYPKAKPEKWFKKLKGLEEPWDGDAATWLEERSAQPIFIEAVGTIGHGNHFAELVRIEEINDGEIFQQMQLDKDALFLIVHSGSRGLGESLLRSHTDRFKAGSLKMESDEAFVYLTGHNHAVLWARANRELIALRFLEQLHSGYQKIVDCCHNSVNPVDSTVPCQFLHRKGAAPSDCGAVIIPGSRGSYCPLLPTATTPTNHPRFAWVIQLSGSADGRPGTQSLVSSTWGRTQVDSLGVQRAIAGSLPIRFAYQNKAGKLCNLRRQRASLRRGSPSIQRHPKRDRGYGFLWTCSGHSHVFSACDL